MGIAGDTLQIKNRVVYINNVAGPLPEFHEFKYHVTTNGTLDPDELNNLAADPTHIHRRNRRPHRAQCFHQAGARHIDANIVELKMGMRMYGSGHHEECCR